MQVCFSLPALVQLQNIHIWPKWETNKTDIYKGSVRVWKMQHDRSALPVLLTFLKLPKLLSFHILRLAAWEERKVKNRQRENIKWSSLLNLI